MSFEGYILIAGFLVLGSILYFVLKTIGQNPSGSMDKKLEALAQEQERFEKILKDELGRNREEFTVQERATREEMNRQLFQITQVNEQKLDSIRLTLEKQLKSLQEDNGLKLDQMRNVVDEKLQATLEK